MNNKRHFFDIGIEWCHEARNPHCRINVPAIDFAVKDWKQFLDKACECGALTFGELKAYVDEQEVKPGG